VTAKGKLDWYFVSIAFYMILQIGMIVFGDSIQMQFEANRPAWDFESAGIISKDLRSNNFPAYVALSRVGYSVYMSEKSAYKDDFLRAKTRGLILQAYLVLMIVIVFFLDKARLSKTLSTSSQLFSLGVGLFALGITFYICDRVWLINFFFQKTKQVLPLISNYSNSENTVQLFFLVLLPIALIYFYRNAQEQNAHV
jgi:hypothetical membrane protein